MKPQIFTGQTHVLNKPRNWNERKQGGQCKGLPCLVKSGRVYSQWEFSFLERIKILFGKPLTLTVISPSMPPVSLEIRKVFENE